jgi:hypothetical protein
VTTGTRELPRFRLDLVRVQEVRWDKEGTVGVEGYTFSYGEGNENHQMGTGFLQQRILSSVKTVEFLAKGCRSERALV